MFLVYFRPCDGRGSSRSVSAYINKELTATVAYRRRCVVVKSEQSITRVCVVSRSD